MQTFSRITEVKRGIILDPAYNNQSCEPVQPSVICVNEAAPFLSSDFTRSHSYSRSLTTYTTVELSIWTPSTKPDQQNTVNTFHLTHDMSDDTWRVLVFTIVKKKKKN